MQYWLRSVGDGGGVGDHNIFLSRWHPADMSGPRLISRWGGAQLTLVEFVGGGGGAGGVMQKKQPH